MLNDYDDVKGREDSFTIRLDGLNNYDLWYYADLITSSSVKVTLDGEKWQKVQVTEKNITLPDGEANNGILEISLNYAKYDAVAM